MDDHTELRERLRFAHLDRPGVQSDMRQAEVVIAGLERECEALRACVKAADAMLQTSDLCYHGTVATASKWAHECAACGSVSVYASARAALKEDSHA